MMTFGTFISFILIIFSIYFFRKARETKNNKYYFIALIGIPVLIGMIIVVWLFVIYPPHKKLSNKGLQEVALNLYASKSADGNFKEQDFSKEELEKPIDRPKYDVKDGELYNVIILSYYDKPVTEPSTNDYLPNSTQLKSNIPQCIEPTKQQAIDYINAYDKVYYYLTSKNSYNHSQPKQMGLIAKAVLDFNYNYHNYEYFKSLYNLKSVKEAMDLGMQITYDSRESIKKILDANFTEQEQEKLAKETLELYNQSRDNCVQAGYGEEFYQVFWAGMPESNYTQYQASAYIQQTDLLSIIDTYIFDGYLSKEKVDNQYFNQMYDGIKKYELIGKFKGFDSGRNANSEEYRYPVFAVLSKQLADFGYIGGELYMNWNVIYRVISNNPSIPEYMHPYLQSNYKNKLYINLINSYLDFLKKKQSSKYKSYALKSEKNLKNYFLDVCSNYIKNYDAMNLNTKEKNMYVVGYEITKELCLFNIGKITYKDFEDKKKETIDLFN